MEELKQNKIKLLFDYYDNCNFVSEIITQMQLHYDVIVYKWVNGDDILRHQHLKWADIIFCEWAVSNAVWYSKNKMLHQKLYIRLHRWELNSHFFNKITWKNVTKLICISPQMQRFAISKNPEISDKSICIYNYVKSSMFNNLDKTEDSHFNIGIMGILPRCKRLDIAIDIIQHLRTVNNKYKLYVLGKTYKDDVIARWKTGTELAFHININTKIKELQLENHIIFEPYTEHPEIWLMKIGFILSVSDIEGSHQAVAESMTTGTIPCIYGGALRDYKLDDIYPRKYCFYEPNIHALCDKIIAYSNGTFLINERNYCKQFCQDNFTVDIIYKQIIKKFSVI